MQDVPTGRVDPSEQAGDDRAVTSTPRRADIQGLRAVAVVLVVLFHSGLGVPGGFVGVDVFFVISGFVVTGMLLRELHGTDQLDLRMFYARRARRLLPALAVMLVVVAVVSVLLLSPVGASQVRTATTGGATAVFASNLAQYLQTEPYFDNHYNPLIHTWTLAVEEQFYVFFPPLLLLGWRAGRGRRGRLSPTATATGVLLLVAGASLALSWWLTGVDSRFAFYASPTRAWEFAAGALLALAVPLVARIGRATASVVAVAGLALIAIAAWRITPTTPFPGTAALLPVVGALLVIGAGTAARTWVSGALSTRPAVCIGDLSYGWYLWHWPAIVFARACYPATTWVLPLAGIGALGPAWLSYRIVENPIRMRPAVVGRRLYALVAACVLVPLAACAGLRTVALGVRSGDGVVGDIVRQLALPYAFVHECHSLGSAVAEPTCSWQAPGASRGRVVLVGDSNAAQFAEPLVRAAADLGLDFAVATVGSCPLVDVEFPAGTLGTGPCRTFVDETLAELQRHPPDLLVLASASPTYIEGGDVSIRDPDSGHFVGGRDAKAALWELGLASVVDRMDRAGVPTVVVHPIPYFGAWSVGLCPAFRLYTDVRQCGTSRSRAAVEKYRHRAVEAEQAAISGLAHVRGLDLVDDLCSPASCRTNTGRQWIYRDASHLTIAGALTLTDRFTELLRPVAA